jgi:hypothetical protein
LEAANYSGLPLETIWVSARLVGEKGVVHLQDQAGPIPLAAGSAQSLKKFVIDFHTLPAPARYKLVVSLARNPAGKGLIAENDWDLWLYPPSLNLDTPTGVRVIHALTDPALDRLREGEKVVWFLAPDQVRPDERLGPVALGFSSIFWNTAWTRRQAPHTLGILCDPKHPLFSHFPTDYHSNWQWWYLVSQASAMILDDLPAALRPTVQVIDDWFTARKLGLVFEAKVGRGRLLVCSIDLDHLSQNPVARQFHHSLTQYVASDRFQPNIEVTVDNLRHMVRSPLRADLSVPEFSLH